MVEAILRRVGIEFIMTVMPSELLKERARFSYRLEDRCHTRYGRKETLLTGWSVDLYIRSAPR